MNDQSAKRIVLGSVLAIVAVTEARRVVDHKGPSLPPLVGGLVAASLLTALSGPAPEPAALVALIALVTSLTRDGAVVLDAVAKVPGNIGKATAGQDYTPTPYNSLRGAGTDLSLAAAFVPDASTQGAGMLTFSTRWGRIKASPQFAAKLAPMIEAAAGDGVRLFGSAWRSSADQFRLRGEHGCKGREMDHSCKANPPTAVPGDSRHETGDAIDFQNCDSHSTKAYKWLAANAGKFGIYNLSSEPWHWSTDGH